MPVIAVANPKAGSGKTTLATNLAGYLASRGHAVMLGDVDRQRATLRWLEQRPVGLPPIGTWETSGDPVVRPPRGTTHVVLDTPAGLHGKALTDVLRVAQQVLVPLQPGHFDVPAVHTLLHALLERRRSGGLAVAAIAMRADADAADSAQLRALLESLHVPLLTFLRDTQNYVHLGGHGLSLWDVASTRFERDIEQWVPIVNWVN